MGTTPNGLVYSELSDAPDGPGGFKGLGLSVDAIYGLAVADWATLLAVPTPFTGMRVWVTDLGGAAVYNGAKWIQPLVEFAMVNDEDRTSTTTVTDDAELFCALNSIGTYVIDLNAYAESAADAAGDMKSTFTFPTGTLQLTGTGPDQSLATGSVQTGEWKSLLAMTSGSNTIGYGLSASPTSLRIHGLLVVTASGTLKHRWAQQNSSASKSTLKAGTHWSVRQIA